MPFERFTKRIRSTKPKVSIWSRGQIGFNSGVVQKFNLDQFDYAVLFFDRENRMIGVKFTSDENEAGVIKVTKRPNGISFSAKGFLQYYDVDHTETKQYDVVKDVESDIFVVDLKA